LPGYPRTFANFHLSLVQVGLVLRMDSYSRADVPSELTPLPALAK
jgi:hypothetical protein